MTTTTNPSSTSKVRRDIVGGKRPTRRRDRIRRPDPTRIGLGPTDESLTSMAGLARFGAFLREQGIDRALREFRSLKPHGGTVYPMDAQLRLLIDAHAAGETRVFGVEALSSDPLFVRLAGGVVPSIDTLYRDLNRFDEEALEKLEALMAQKGLDRERLRAHDDVHLDVDTTVEPQFGEKEGARPGPNPRYRGRPSYHPIVCRVAELDTCVGAQLRPGDRAFGTEDVDVVRKIVRRVSAQLHARQRLWVRIDGAGDDASLFTMFQQERVLFVTKPRLTPNLWEAASKVKDWRAVDWDAFDKPITEVADIAFERPSWREAGANVRVIAVRTREPRAGRQLYLWDGLDWTVKLYLTNSDDPAEPELRADFLRSMTPGRDQNARQGGCRVCDDNDHQPVEHLEGAPRHRGRQAPDPPARPHPPARSNAHRARAHGRIADLDGRTCAVRCVLARTGDRPRSS